MVEERDIQKGQWRVAKAISKAIFVGDRRTGQSAGHQLPGIDKVADRFNVCAHDRLSTYHGCLLSEQLFDDIAKHVSEPHIAATVAEGELQVIEPQQVQHRCVQVM